MDKEFDDLAKTLYAYDLRSLYFAWDHLWKFEVDVKNKLDLYNEYMPCRKVINSKEIEKLYEPIKSELKEKFEEYLVPIDSKFAQENYRYVINEVENEKIQKVYKILGPVDFYMKKDSQLKDAIEEEANRTMQTHFLNKKRSGNKYRGETTDTGDADGWGFKIFSSGGTYEGYF